LGSEAAAPLSDFYTSTGILSFQSDLKHDEIDHLKPLQSNLDDLIT
jgi:hypothetical protein